MTDQSDLQAQGSKKSAADGWNPDINQDELIREQERKIEKEIAENSPLIGDALDLQVLLNEYAETDGSFVCKIEELLKTFKMFRRTRPDGNCFFRGLAFAYFEYLLTHEEDLQKFMVKLEELFQMLVDVGFTGFTIQDFYDTFVGVLKPIEKKEMKTVEELQEVFNDSGLSNYLVVFMRIITSGYLQKNQEFFQHFIDDHATVKDFCGHEVEPMNRESDHIHVTAITQATDIPVSISYLNRTDGSIVTHHTFPDGAEPKIYLLYRPGHYDILYKRE